MQKERNTRYCAIRAARSPGVWMAATLLVLLTLAFCAPASAAVLYWDGCKPDGTLSEGVTQGDGTWTAWSLYPDGWQLSTALSSVRNNAAPHNVPKAAYSSTAGQAGYAEIQANLTAAGYWAIAATQTGSSLGAGVKTVSNVTGWVGLPTTTTIFSTGNAWNTMGTYLATSATPKIRFGENGTTTNRWYLDQIRWTSATPTAPTQTYPADGATNVPVTGIGNELIWTPGNYNYSYDVYLSTVQNDVDTKAPGAKVSPDQLATSFDPDPLGLVSGTTYYWKVVARNVDATAETPTRSFTATSTLAYVMTGQAVTDGSISTTGGTVSGPAYYLPLNPAITWTEAPSPHYYFMGWTSDQAGTIPVPGSTSPTWTFTPTGDMTFYGQFVTDTTAPTGSIEINPPTHTANSYIVNLVLSASDAQSGLDTMCFANDDFYSPGNPGAFSTPVPYATSASWTLITDPEQGGGPGTKIVYVKYKDKEGNESVFSNTVSLSGNTLVLTACEDHGAPTGAGVYVTNESVTVHANPKPGYAFEKWTTDGCGGYDIPVGSSQDYTFNMPGYDYHLYANYVIIPYALTVNACANGSVGGDSGTKTIGTPCEVTATPAENYRFKDWTTDGCGGSAVASTSATFDFNMPANDYTLSANFEYVPLLTLHDVPSGDGTPAGGGRHNLGSSVSLSANPASGYKLYGWSTDAAGLNVISTASSFNYTMPAVDTDLYAQYAPADFIFKDSFENTLSAWAVGGGSPSVSTAQHNIGSYSLQINGWVDYVNHNLATLPSSAKVGFRFWMRDSGQSNAKGFHADLRSGTSMVLGLGIYNSAGTPISVYQYRAMGSPTIGSSWTNLGTPRTAGWRRCDISYDGTAGATVNYYIDGVQVKHVTDVVPHAIDMIRIGEGGSSGTMTPWYFDDVALFNNPKLLTTGVQGGGGTVSGAISGSALTAASGLYCAKEHLTLTAAPASSYFTFLHWVDAGGAEVSTANPYSFQMPAGDTTVMAVFQSTDTTPPTGAIQINGGAASTNTRNVTLTLSATDSETGVAQMRFSDDGVTFGDAVTFAVTTPYTLPAGDGTKTVYVQYKDVAGNWSAPTAISDSIVLDATPPTGTIQINGGDASTNSVNVTLTLSADDGAGSGVAQMKFSNDGVTFGDPVAYATTSPYTLPSGDGTKTVYVVYIDALGNASAPTAISDTIELTSCAVPTGTTNVPKISGLWALANDPTVYNLTGKMVTAVWSDGFWIEETDRGAGIKVLYDSGTACTSGGAFGAGDSVDVYGTLSTGDMRLLTAGVVVNHGAGTAIEPVIVTEKYGGGKGVNVTTPAVAGGKGVYGVGLLVRLAGTAGNAGAGFFYLDDGSGLKDVDIPGMKILCGGLTVPSSGQKVVTGVIGIIAGKPVIYATSIQ